MDKENILVEAADGTISTISVTNFYIGVCRGLVEPLLKLMDGRLYEHEGRKYCVRADAFELDEVAKAWLFEK